jgi:hypothetical protein
VDVEKVNKIESDLDLFIERRVRQRDDEDLVAEAWEMSERRDRDRRQRENRQAWVSFERHMERLHLGLAEEHHQKAMKLLEEPEF